MLTPKIRQALIIAAALLIVIRFRSQIVGLLAKVPVVNKLAAAA